METIPAEIWTEVFAFSCTDDGYTGRSLSAVSRAVHHISKPLKYQSLCIVGGLDRLFRLLAVLSHLSPGERKVKYLFIGGLDDSKGFESPDGSTDVRRALHPGKDTTEQALAWILHLVSSSLIALHLHHTKILRQFLLPEIELPVLRELTLHGPFKSSQPANPRPHTLFPSLRRLHIHHFGYNPANFLQQIVYAAPRLTHLWVPQSSFTPYDIQVALGMLEPTGESASEAVYLPSTLEELVIEVYPGPTRSSLEFWESNLRAIQFLKKLQKISDGDGRVCLVDGGNDWIPVEQAKQEWLEMSAVQCR
ncbi:hypothetical protein B0H13DRAFT_1140189 [Mycena leptocephala]|nr:hypothetical protein B0H13DRAFT_1140189 [Mycena leptocephala]